MFYTAGSEENNIQLDQYQEGTYDNAVATGSANALTATIPSNLNFVPSGFGFTLTAAYANTAVLTSPAVGRQALAAFTGTQLANQQATSADITQGQQPSQLSQIVFTVALVGTSMTSISAGTVYFNLNYTQPDGSIGSATAYPYGNFD